MRRLLLPLVFLIALGGFLSWWFSPAQRVKRHTRDLMEVLTLDVATPSGTRNLGGFKLERLLAPRIEFNVPSIAELHGSHDRSEVSQGFGYLCGAAKETRFRVKQIGSVVVEGDKARVTATLEIHVDLKNPQSVDETGVAVLHWVKSEDGWRLEGADWAPARK